MSRREFLSRLLRKNLFLVNISVSSVLQAAGDILQQHVERKLKIGSKIDQKVVAHDWNRTGRMAAIGLVLGAVGHTWYTYLDQRFRMNTSKSLVRKIFLDQMIGSPVMAFTFIGGLSLLEGNKFLHAIREFFTKFPDIYVTDCCVWPPTQLINFYYMPPQMRTIYVAAMDFLWYRYSSYVKYRSAEC